MKCKLDQPHRAAVRRFGLTLPASMLFAPAISAQDFTLEQSVIAPGGDSSGGDDWTLDATIGQPAAGLAQGDDYVLFAGFWVPDNVEAPPSEVVFSEGFEETP